MVLHENDAGHGSGDQNQDHGCEAFGFSTVFAQQEIKHSAADSPDRSLPKLGNQLDDAPGFLGKSGDGLDVRKVRTDLARHQFCGCKRRRKADQDHNSMLDRDVPEHRCRDQQAHEGGTECDLDQKDDGNRKAQQKSLQHAPASRRTAKGHGYNSCKGRRPTVIGGKPAHAGLGKDHVRFARCHDCRDRDQQNEAKRAETHLSRQSENRQNEGSKPEYGTCQGNRSRILRAQLDRDPENPVIDRSDRTEIIDAGGLTIGRFVCRIEGGPKVVQVTLVIKEQVRQRRADGNQHTGGQQAKQADKAGGIVLSQIPDCDKHRKQQDGKGISRKGNHLAIVHFAAEGGGEAMNASSCSGVPSIPTSSNAS